MDALIIGNQSDREISARVIRAWRTGTAESAARLDFVALDDAWKLLSDKRRQVMRAMAGAGPLSIREAARRVVPEDLFLSAITVLELELGVFLKSRLYPTQGAVLRRWVDQFVLPAFAGRILSVGTAVARRCAALHVPDPRSERDALIAATALVHRLTVATRNVADFHATGVAPVNPFG